jgi:hypothetical protein
VTARRVARLALALGAALVLTMFAAGCGESSADGEPAADRTTETVPIDGVGETIGGSVAPLAQCRDWREGTIDERMATIEDIRGQLTPQTSEGEESDLPDDEAYDLFQRVCARDYASAFRLYKVYVNRAGFKPLAP